MALYGPDGFPIPPRFLDAARETGARPPMQLRTESIRRSVDTLDWRTVVSVSRNLYANMGVPRGAIRQKADFAIGDAWQPIHCGADKSQKVKEWAKVATDVLTGQFYPMCEVRGGAFDFVSSLNVDSVTIDRDGGFGVLLTESADGFPQTQRIPIHRFGHRWDCRGSIIEDGQFKGMRLHQGIIYAPSGRPIGFRIYEESDDVIEPIFGKFEDIAERDLIHVYEPDFYDMGHGLPAFIHALNDLRDCKQSKEWEQMAMLIASQIGLIEKNEAGGLDKTDPAYQNTNPNADGDPIHTEVLSAGGVTVRYFKSNSGNGIEQFVNNRPGEDWERFNDRLIRGALCGIGWPSSFIWKAEGTGVDSREDILQCRMSVAKRQRVLKPMAKRIVGYAISKFIKRGDIPPYPGADQGGFLRWDFQMPARMTVDDGREASQKREDYKLGSKNMIDILADDGSSYESHQNQRETEIIDLITRAKHVAEETEIPFDTALSLFQQRTSNANAPGGRFGNVFSEDTTIEPIATGAPP